METQTMTTGRRKAMDVFSSCTRIPKELVVETISRSMEGFLLSPWPLSAQKGEMRLAAARLKASCLPGMIDAAAAFFDRWPDIG